MKKHELNFVIDAFAAVAFILLISTGIIMFWLLPPGSGHMEIWGMNRHGWGDIHFWVSVAFIVLIGTHLFMHWSWIMSKMKGREKANGEEATSSKRRFRLLLAAFVLVVLLAVAPFFSGVTDTREGDSQTRGKEHTERVIQNP